LKIINNFVGTGKELSPDEMAAKMMDAMPKSSVPNPAQ